MSGGECPACGHALAANITTCPASDGGRHDYVRCPACGTQTLLDAPPTDHAYPAPSYGTGPGKFPAALEWLRTRSQRARARLVRRMCPGETPRVLDIGCGSGDFLRALATMGCAIHGTELAGPALGRASTVPGINLTSGDLREDSYPAGTFDAITLWHVLEHLPDPQPTLALCRRLLSPGGVLVVEVPNATSGQARLFGSRWLHLDPPRHTVQLTRDGLSRLLARAGFRIETRSTWSWQMGVFGYLQSALNRLGIPPNLLYEMLLTRGRFPGPAWGKAASVGLTPIILPLAMIATWLEAVAGRGAVMRCICRPDSEGTAGAGRPEGILEPVTGV